MVDTEYEGLRLQVYLAKCGVGSRRKCETLIAAGKVAVNNSVIRVQGTKVHSKDVVTFEGKEVKPTAYMEYILLNKPEGYLCSNYDAEGRPIAIDLLKASSDRRLFHVGRLDFKSSGLIIYTNDGAFANAVSHPSSEIEKEYLLEVDKPLLETDLSDFKTGVNVDGVCYRMESYRKINQFQVALVLVEGKNREIRNLFASRGYYVRKLKRIRIGSVTSFNLRPGDYRNLTEQEIHDLTISAKRGKHGSRN